MTVTPEIIAAFADGELDGDDKLRVEAAIAADPELAGQVERHRKLKTMLAARYAPIAAAPVPDRLSALIEQSPKPAPGSGEVVSLAEVRARRGMPRMIRRWMPVAGPAIAASLVLALWQPWQGNERAGYASAELASMLENRLVADQPANALPRILLSFAASDGRMCRAWRGASDGGIACRYRDGWKIDQRFSLDGARAGEYRQASSEGDILAAAQEMSASDALDASEEQRAMADGWIR